MTKAELVWTLIGLILLALRPLAEKPRERYAVVFASALSFGVALAFAIH